MSNRPARKRRDDAELFAPPPHANAAGHAKLMAALAKMTADEIFQMSVRSGIYTPDGQLTPEYGGAPRKKSAPKKRPTTSRRRAA